MSKAKPAGGGRWRPGEVTGGMRIGMAARAAAEDEIRRRIQERRLASVSQRQTLQGGDHQ